MNNILVFIFCAWVAIALIMLVRSWLDRWGWSAGANPDENAVIVSKTSNFVRQKSASNFEIKITFSDGFWYITHAAKREKKFARYEFTLDEEQVARGVEKAIRIHGEEVKKKRKRMNGKHKESVPSPQEGIAENERPENTNYDARLAAGSQNSPTFWEGNDEDVPF